MKKKKTLKKYIIISLVSLLLLVSLLTILFCSTFPRSSIYAPPGIIRVSAKLGFIDLNDKDYLCFTALHLNSTLGRNSHITTLVRCGADLESKNIQGWTPLHTAVINYRGNISTIKLLIGYGANIHAKTNDGETPLIFAINHHDSPELIKYLIKCGSDISAEDKEGNTALHCAVKNGHYLVAQELLNHDANMLALNENDTSPLSESFMLKDDRFAKLILSKINTRNRDEHGRTALHLVAASGNLEFVKIVIGRGADLNVKDNYGNTPIELAKESIFSNQEIVDYLNSLQKYHSMKN